MSLVVKFIKQNKATVQAISDMVSGDYPEGSADWWEARVQVVQDFFRNNPLNLGVPNDGAADFIKDQVERGNKHDKSRVKIWNHIAMELLEIPDFAKHVAEEARASKLSEQEIRATVQRAMDLADKTPYLPSPDQRRPSASGDHGVPHLPSTLLNLIAEEARATRAAYMAAAREARRDSGIEEARGAMLYTRTMDEEHTDGRPVDLESDDEEPDSDDEEQEEYEEDDGLLVIAGAASQGGLVGRQELWLAQKRSKIHSKRREQEALLQNDLTFVPDTQDSRRTFRMKSATQPAQIPSARRSSMPTAMPLPPTKEELDPMDARRRSYADSDVVRRLSAADSTLSSKARRSSLDTVAAGPQPTPATRRPEEVAGPDRRRRLSAQMRRLSKIKDTPGDKGSKKGRKKKESKDEQGDDDDDDAPRRRSFSPSTLRGHDAPLLGDTPSELRRSRSLTDFEAAAAAANAATQSLLEHGQRAEGGDGAEEGAEGKDEAPPELTREGSSENRWRLEHPDSPYLFDVFSDTYVPGEFFQQISGDRGYIKLRNGADFQMRSMYRKKDKFNRIPGVSLLVGRLERPPHDERIINIMFDLDTFTEAQAWDWWVENKRRFLDDSYQRAVAAGRKGSITSEAAGDEKADRT